jgi:hypothetical protein
MDYIFSKSEFSGDITKWEPLELKKVDNLFSKSKCIVPYWANYSDTQERINAIKLHRLEKGIVKELNDELTLNSSEIKKKIKI